MPTYPYTGQICSQEGFSPMARPRPLLLDHRTPLSLSPLTDFYLHRYLVVGYGYSLFWLATGTMSIALTVLIDPRSFLLALNSRRFLRLQARSFKASSLPSILNQGCSTASLAVSRFEGLTVKSLSMRSCRRHQEEKEEGTGSKVKWLRIVQW